MRYDVTVVGAGVIGSSIAYHLSRAGASVRLLDPNPGASPSASWASAGGVRSQGRDEREWALTVEAGARWPRLAHELGRDLEFRQGGHLHVTEDPKALPALAARVERERAAGLEVELVDTATALSIAPLLSERVAGAAFSRGDGQANPRLVTEAFREAAVRCGATFERERVRDLRLGSPKVVLAAGSWTAWLARSAGVQVAISVAGLQMLRTDPANHVLEPTISSEERALSFKQLPDGAFYIGGGWPAEVSDEGCQVLDSSVEGSWRTACELVPSLRERRISERLCGLESFTPEGVPFIGPAPEQPWLYVAAGFCGHGFQLSPAIGRKVADELRLSA